MTDLIPETIVTPLPEHNITNLLELATTNEGVAEYLHGLVDLTGQYFETTDAIPAIMVLCERWVNDTQIDLNDTQSRNHLCAMLRLAAFLTGLRSSYETLQIEARQ